MITKKKEKEKKNLRSPVALEVNNYNWNYNRKIYVSEIWAHLKKFFR